MRSNHTQLELDGDLFSGLDEAQEPQVAVHPYDKIIESRKNTTFAAEQIESQDEVQVVEKEPKNVVLLLAPMASKCKNFLFKL